MVLLSFDFLWCYWVGSQCRLSPEFYKIKTIINLFVSYKNMYVKLWVIPILHYGLSVLILKHFVSIFFIITELLSYIYMFKHCLCFSSTVSVYLWLLQALINIPKNAFQEQNMKWKHTSSGRYRYFCKQPVIQNHQYLVSDYKKVYIEDTK